MKRTGILLALLSLHYIAFSQLADSISNRYTNSADQILNQDHRLVVGGYGEVHYNQPLDASAVHPESYPVVEEMARDAGTTVEGLMKDTGKTRSLDLKRYVSRDRGMPTLIDIVTEDLPDTYNYIGFSNERADELIEAGLKELDQAKRELGDLIHELRPPSSDAPTLGDLDLETALGSSAAGALLGTSRSITSRMASALFITS